MTDVRALALALAVALVVAGALVVAVAGCGNSTDPGSQGRAGGAGGIVSSQPTPSEPTAGKSPGETPSGQPSTANPPASPAPTFTDDLTVSPPAAVRGRLMTVRGTIQPGVEAGCLILSTEQGAYLLVGPRTAGLKAGMTVEVSGAPDETIATACQQGIPFIVTEVKD